MAFDCADGLTTADGKYVLSFIGSAERLELPCGVTVIADEAFTRCRVVEAVLPEGLKTIGRDAFRWRSELKKADIPSSVSYISEGAFANCIGAVISIDKPCGYLGGDAFPSGTRLLLNTSAGQIDVTLTDRVRAESCDERRLWALACEPSQEAFDSLQKEEYKLACAIALYGGGLCVQYLKENITRAVCFAAKYDTAMLERVLSYDLLGPVELKQCVDFTVQEGLTQQQVILLRCGGGHFGERNAKRFEL